MKIKLTLIILLFSIITFGQNCKSVKTGRFTLKIKDIEYTIKRTEKKEIISSKYGIIKHKIKWLTDCKYILFNTKPKSTKGMNSDLIFDNSYGIYDTIYNKIIEVNNSGFKIESSDKNSSYSTEYVYQKKQKLP